MLYQCLTGKPAFWTGDSTESRRRVLEEVGPRLPPDIPEPLSVLVHAMLKRDPKQRPESASGCARALRAFLATERPEGVGDELSERAQRAAKPTGDSQIVTVTSRKGGRVQTLATSALLRAARDSDRPPVMPDPANAPDPATAPGTEKIERTENIERASAGPEAAPTSTSPATDVDGTEGEDGPTAAPAAGSDEAPPQSGTRRWAVIAAIATIGTVGIAALLISSGKPFSTESATPVSETEPSSRTEPTSGTEVAGTLTAPDNAVVGMPSATSREDRASVHTSLERASWDDSPSEPSDMATRIAAMGAPAAPPGVGRVTVTAVPWAQVRLGNRVLGNTPQRNIRIPVGNQTLLLTNDALGRRVSIPLRVTPGAEFRVQANLQQDPPRFRVQ